MFFIFNTNPRFPPFLLYVRCKSGVTFIRRSFRDGHFVGFIMTRLKYESHWGSGGNS